MKQPFLPLFAAVIIATTSCVSVKPIEYLQSNEDTTITNNLKYREAIIEPGDLISIFVYSDNQSASSIYNAGGSSTSQDLSAIGTGQANLANNSTNSSSKDQGYLVTEDGSIIMAGLGKVYVGGFTQKRLADSLVEYFQINNLLSHPSVDIRFLNYKITVLGEVQRPGQYSVPGDKINILEALGLAGDFTVWAKRDNVTVIRDENGTRVLGRIDVTSPRVFTSPYYYLKQNDIVMVDQVKQKAKNTDLTTLRYVTISTSIISAAALLINIFKN